MNNFNFISAFTLKLGNFGINFSNPWWLLAFPVAIALTLIPFYMIKKERRYNRNRVVSLVLRLVALTMVVFLLSAPVFEINEANSRGEVILLVDQSESTTFMRDEMDTWVKDILDASDGEFRTGVITFGYGEASYTGMDYNTQTVYDRYKNASINAETASATDIESAMMAAYEKFSNPATARIIVISDGAETDGKANYAAQLMKTRHKDIRVDTIYCRPPVNSRAEDEIQLSSIDLKQENIKFGDTVDITVTIKNNPKPGAEARVSLTDTIISESMKAADTKVITNTRGEEATTVRLDNGTTTVTWKYTFEARGLHQLSAKVTSATDSLDQNNEYFSHVFISGNSKVLILEGAPNEGAQLASMINNKPGEPKYEAVVKPIETVMATGGLAGYDEVILANVSRSQFEPTFEKTLDEFVKKFGGGLLTTGGNNAYKAGDMAGSVFEGILPVDADPRGQPLALLLVIDSSTSMCPPGQNPQNDSYGVTGSRLDYAKRGAKAAVDVVDPGDYVGIVSFNSDVYFNLDMTPASRKQEIYDAIGDTTKGIKTHLGTRYNNAVEMVNRMMSAITFTDRKHVIFLTDGEPQDGLDTQWTFNRTIESMYASGITFSTVGVSADIGQKGDDILSAMAAYGHGLANPQDAVGKYYHKVLDITQIAAVMRAETAAQEIKWDNPGETEVNVKSRNTSIALPSGSTMPKLNGFYAVKAKGYPGDPEDQIGKVILATPQGNPIYAEWDYGAGHVASFMSTLSGATGSWGANYISADGSGTGPEFISNVVKSMMAEKSTSGAGAKIEFNPDDNGNYKTFFRVTGLAMEEGDSVTGKVTGPDGEQTVKVDRLGLDLFQGEFKSEKAGIYKLEITRRGATADRNASLVDYTTFAYSKEFNAFPDGDYLAQCEAFMGTLAATGGGQRFTEVTEMFSAYTLGLIRTFDPRLALLIIAVVLFLLDIAARKFKFLWPHEIWRKIQGKRAAKAAQTA